MIALGTVEPYDQETLALADRLMNLDNCGDQAMTNYADRLHRRPRQEQRKTQRRGEERSRELTLGPVGPLRHMGVVVARHSTQHILPASAAAIEATPIT